MSARKSNYHDTKACAAKCRQVTARKASKQRKMEMHQKASLHCPHWVNDNYYGPYVPTKRELEAEARNGWEPEYEENEFGDLDLVGYRRLHGWSREWEASIKDAENRAAVIPEFEYPDLDPIFWIEQEVWHALHFGLGQGWMARAMRMAALGIQHDDMNYPPPERPYVHGSNHIPPFVDLHT